MIAARVSSAKPVAAKNVQAAVSPRSPPPCWASSPLPWSCSPPLPTPPRRPASARCCARPTPPPRCA
eukprot:XP_001697649.1 low-CO2-inducible protein [Chlamydomonas reinhardtii]